MYLQYFDETAKKSVVGLVVTIGKGHIVTVYELAPSFVLNLY